MNLPLLRPLQFAACLAFVACTSAFCQSSDPVAPPAPPTLEQRVSGIEAYFKNSDPAASLNVANGNAPAASPASIAGLPGPGHNVWMMVSAILVLFMTLPGLTLFYGGLVRVKNVLSVMAWCLGITSLVTVLWWAVGYSLVFGKNFHSPYLGGTEFFFLHGVDAAPNRDYSFWVSHNIFAMFQLMFAIITPAVLIGAVVERMKFGAVMLFVGCWVLCVYCPLAHMVWGINGFMNGLANSAASIKAIDFAGGMVVEMASGCSALILCLILGIVWWIITMIPVPAPMVWVVRVIFAIICLIALISLLTGSWAFPVFGHGVLR